MMHVCVCLFRVFSASTTLVRWKTYYENEWKLHSEVAVINYVIPFLFRAGRHDGGHAPVHVQLLMEAPPNLAPKHSLQIQGSRCSGDLVCTVLPSSEPNRESSGYSRCEQNPGLLPFIPITDTTEAAMDNEDVANVRVVLAILASLVSNSGKAFVYYCMFEFFSLYFGVWELMTFPFIWKGCRAGSSITPGPISQTVTWGSKFPLIS